MCVLWSTKLSAVHVCWHWVYLQLPKWALKTQTNSSQPLQPFLRPGPNPLQSMNASDLSKSRVWGL